MGAAGVCISKDTTQVAPHSVLKLRCIQSLSNPSINKKSQPFQTVGLSSLIYRVVGQSSGSYDIYFQIFDATGTKVGSETLVNSHATGSQEYPDVSSLFDSTYADFVIAFQDGDAQDGDMHGVFFQMIQNDGTFYGSNTQANTYITNSQQVPVVTGLTDGKFVIAWTSNLQDGDGYGVYFQIFSNSGTKLGSETQANTFTPNYQNLTAVAHLTNGKFIIAWQSIDQDGSGYGIYFQRFTSDGLPLGSETAANTHTSGDQGVPTITSFRNSDAFLVGWESSTQDTGTYGIYYQLFDINGDALGSETQVNTNTTGDQRMPAVAVNEGKFWFAFGYYEVYLRILDAPLISLLPTEQLVNTYETSIQLRPHVANLTGGRFVTCWESNAQDGSYSGVYFQLYEIDGNKWGAEVHGSTSTVGEQAYCSVIGLSTGNFAMAYKSLPNLAQSPADVFLRIFTSSGSSVTTEITISTTSIAVHEPSFATLHDTTTADFAVFYHLGTTSDADVYFQLFQNDGVKVGTAVQVNQYTSSLQSYSRGVGLFNGKFVAVWSSTGQDGSSFGVYARIFNADGTAFGNEFCLSTTTTGSQSKPKVIALPNGNFVACWHSQNVDSSGEAVVARIFNGEGTAISSEIQVNTIERSLQYSPDATAFDDSSFAITYSDFHTQKNILMQLFHSDGTKWNSELQLNIFVNANVPTCATATDGRNMMIVWTAPDSNTEGVYRQMYNFRTIFKVQVVAGEVSTFGDVAGFLPSNRLWSPLGLSVDNSNGRIYICGSATNKIKFLSISDANPPQLIEYYQLFSAVYADVAYDPLDDVVYITKCVWNTIVKTDGSTDTTVVGSVAGFLDGIGTAAKITSPQGLCISGRDMFLTEPSHVIRRIALSNYQVTHIAGLYDTAGSVDGVVGTSQILDPRFCTVDHSQKYMYFAEKAMSGTGAKVRRLDIATTDVTTIVSVGVNLAEGIAYEQNEHGIGPILYVVATNLYQIKRVNLWNNNEVETIVGTGGTSGFQEGQGIYAKLNLDSNSVVMFHRKQYLSMSHSIICIYPPTIECIGPEIKIHNLPPGTYELGRCDLGTSITSITLGPLQDVSFLIDGVDSAPFNGDKDTLLKDMIFKIIGDLTRVNITLRDVSIKQLYFHDPSISATQNYNDVRFNCTRCTLTTTGGTDHSIYFNDLILDNSFFTFENCAINRNAVAVLAVAFYFDTTVLRDTTFQLLNTDITAEDTSGGFSVSVFYWRSITLEGFHFFVDGGHWTSKSLTLPASNCYLFDCASMSGGTSATGASNYFNISNMHASAIAPLSNGKLFMLDLFNDPNYVVQFQNVTMNASAISARALYLKAVSGSVLIVDSTVYASATLLNTEGTAVDLEGSTFDGILNVTNSNLTCESQTISSVFLAKATFSASAKIYVLNSELRAVTHKADEGDAAIIYFKTFGAFGSFGDSAFWVVHTSILYANGYNSHICRTNSVWGGWSSSLGITFSYNNIQSLSNGHATSVARFFYMGKLEGSIMTLDHNVVLLDAPYHIEFYDQIDAQSSTGSVFTAVADVWTLASSTNAMVIRFNNAGTRSNVNITMTGCTVLFQDTLNSAFLLLNGQVFSFGIFFFANMNFTHVSEKSGATFALFSQTYAHLQDSTVSFSSCYISNLNSDGSSSCPLFYIYGSTNANSNLIASNVTVNSTTTIGNSQVIFVYGSSGNPVSLTNTLLQISDSFLVLAQKTDAQWNSFIYVEGYFSLTDSKISVSNLALSMTGGQLRAVYFYGPAVLMSNFTCQMISSNIDLVQIEGTTSINQLAHVGGTATIEAFSLLLLNTNVTATNGNVQLFEIISTAALSGGSNISMSNFHFVSANSEADSLFLRIGASTDSLVQVQDCTFNFSGPIMSITTGEIRNMSLIFSRNFLAQNASTSNAGIFRLESTGADVVNCTINFEENQFKNFGFLATVAAGETRNPYFNNDVLVSLRCNRYLNDHLRPVHFIGTVDAVNNVEYFKTSVDGTPCETATSSATATSNATATSSATATPTITHNVTYSQLSTSFTISHNGSVSKSLIPVPTPSLTLSSSLSISDSPTVILSKSASLILSKSASLTLSNPASSTLSDTITPPPTPTPTFTASRTVTPTQTTSTSRTNSFSETLALTQSLSMTHTISFPLTVSVSISKSKTQTKTNSKTSSPTKTTTRSETFSATASDEVVCGGQSQRSCIGLIGWCRVSEEGSCYAANCSNLPGEGLCLNNGCWWQGAGAENPAYPCAKPPECKDISNQDECQKRISCKWLPDSSACAIDKTSCQELTTQEVCSRAECAWNDFTSPKCFKMFLHPALCSIVREKSMCLAQSCIWISYMDACGRWDWECEDLPVHPQVCSEINKCIYGDTEKKCVDLSKINFDDMTSVYIVGAEVPATVFPSSPFDVSFLGTPLREQNKIIPVSATLEICPPAVILNASNVSFVLKYYDKERTASVVQEASIPDEGNYSFCIIENASSVVGPISKFEVKTVAPILTGCKATPGKPFVGELFRIDIEGKALDQSGKFLFVDRDESCPSNESFYTPVMLHESSEHSVAQFSVSVNSTYKFCYIHRANIAVECPSFITVDGSPPWYDKEKLEDIAESLPKIDDWTVTAFNEINCRSLQEFNKTSGIFAHPKRMNIQFGNGISPYQSGEMCAAIISPMFLPEIAPNAKVIVLEVFYISLNKGDEARLFVSPGSSVSTISTVPSCTLFVTKKDCETSGCTWSKEGECLMETSTTNLDCPSTFGDLTLARVFSNSHSNVKKSLRLGIPFEGAIVVFCSAKGLKTGIGLSLAYTSQESFCINDCKNAQSTVLGQCQLGKTDFLWACKCNEGYTGEGCSRKATCRGTGQLAEVIVGENSVETFSMSSTPCAAIFRAEPSPTASRMSRFGIGFSMQNVQITPTDCAVGFILIREDGPSGRISKRLCNSDVQELEPDITELFRFLHQTGSSIYVEFASDEGDHFDIQFAAVSLVCPGLLGPSGIPETDAQECHGRGVCAPIDYNEDQSTLPTAAYKCDCRIPFASSVIGETCNTCGFGFMKDTFPICTPATICAQNCTNRGRCISGIGCQCDAEYFGLDCQLPDDGERLGELRVYLKQRVPLNLDDAGNVVLSGYIDRTIMPCALPGASVPCKSEERKKGRKYKQEKKSALDIDYDTAFRRHRLEDNSNATNTSATVNVTDFGLVFNEMIVQGTFPDFIRMDNVSETNRDVSGSFSVVGWVKVTAETKGFWMAKVDSAFYTDGRSPVLEKAYFDMEDRKTPMRKLLLFSEPLRLYFAVLLNGPMKRIDILASRPVNQNRTSSKEDWLYVRHFRLGDMAGQLFDGSWRYLALVISKVDRRIEGQVYIDAITVIGDPNFVQCLPFLPVETAQTQAPNTTDLAVVTKNTGASILWGYRLQGSLDELQVFSRHLPQRSVIKVGGDFEDSSLIPDPAIFFMIAACFVIIIVSLLALFFVLRPRKKEKEDEEPSADLEEQVHGTEKLPQFSGEGLLIHDDDNYSSNSGLHQGSTLDLRFSVHIDDKNRDEKGEKSKAEEQEMGENMILQDIEGEVHRRSPRVVPVDLPEKAEKYRAIGTQKDLEDEDDEVQQRLYILAEIKELANREAAVDKTKANASADGGDASSGGGMGLSNFVSTVQLVGQYAGSSSFPIEWKLSFGSLFFVFNLDFLPATGISFHVVYFITVILTVVAFAALLAVQIKAGLPSQSQILEKLTKTKEERQQCLDEGEKFNPVKEASQRVTLLCTVMLASLYMPVTYQSTMGVVCHRNIMCYYDCYNESIHTAIVIVGIISLLLFSLGIPIFYAFVIYRARSEYLVFLGRVDATEKQKEMERNHWDLYLEAVGSPLARIFYYFRYDYLFGGCTSVIFKLVTSVLLSALTPESLELYLSVGLVQLLGAVVVIGTQPYITKFNNCVSMMCSLFVTVIIFLHSFYLLFPASVGVGVALIVVTVLLLSFGAFIIGRILFMFIKQRMSKKEEGESDAAVVVPVEEDNVLIGSTEEKEKVTSIKVQLSTSGMLHLENDEEDQQPNYVYISDNEEEHEKYGRKASSPGQISSCAAAAESLVISSGGNAGKNADDEHSKEADEICSQESESMLPDPFLTPRTPETIEKKSSTTPQESKTRHENLQKENGKNNSNQEEGQQELKEPKVQQGSTALEAEWKQIHRQQKRMDEARIEQERKLEAERKQFEEARIEQGKKERQFEEARIEQEKKERQFEEARIEQEKKERQFEEARIEQEKKLEAERKQIEEARIEQEEKEKQFQSLQRR